jgi:hypothetical protein
MPIVTSTLKIAIRGRLLGQQIEVVQWYAPAGAAFLTANAVAVGEAYWNDIKALWRACHTDNGDDLTQSIFVAEPGATGAYGEFAIPGAEQQGTRPAADLGGFLPPYCAYAMRQTVSSRVTRPGQKRFWGLGESDNFAGAIGTAIFALYEALAPKFTDVITLGAPVATGTLAPIIVRIDRATGAVTASQNVDGHVTNSNISTQNSRKFGRGS